MCRLYAEKLLVAWALKLRPEKFFKMSLSKACITHLYILTLYIETRSGDLPAEQT